MKVLYAHLHDWILPQKVTPWFWGLGLKTLCRGVREKGIQRKSRPRMEAEEEVTEEIKFWLFFTNGFFIWSCATLLFDPCFPPSFWDILVYLVSFPYPQSVVFYFTCKVPSGWIESHLRIMWQALCWEKCRLCQENLKDSSQGHATECYGWEVVELKHRKGFKEALKWEFMVKRGKYLWFRVCEVYEGGDCFVHSCVAVHTQGR